MSDERDRSIQEQSAKNSERALERLFAHAEPRPMPPPEATEEIRRAIYAEWDAATSRRVWWRRGAALAASVAAFGISAWLVLGVNPPQPAPIVASVERVQGAPGVRLGEQLGAGTTVFTGSGQLALRLASGGSLRLAPQTRVDLTAADSASLTEGTLYFDSEGVRAGSPFAIDSPLGVVRDLGTQFFVRAESERLEIGVRDGRVTLANGANQTDADVGDRLIVAAGSNEIRREAIAAFGDDWAWAERLAPPFDIDGRRLREFLTWFERQTGRTIVFADADAERIAEETVLNGSIDLEPLPKLAAVLTLTDLDYSLEGQRVLISSR